MSISVQAQQSFVYILTTSPDLLATRALSKQVSNFAQGCRASPSTNRYLKTDRKVVRGQLGNCQASKDCFISLPACNSVRLVVDTSSLLETTYVPIILSPSSKHAHNSFTSCESIPTFTAVQLMLPCIVTPLTRINRSVLLLSRFAIHYTAILNLSQALGAHGRSLS